MADLRALPPRSREEETSCEWCHKNYPCHGEGFNRMNCPRVEGIRFLSGEECHYDAKGELVWDIQAVSFKLDVEYVAEAEE